MNYKQSFQKDKDWYLENWDWYINGNYGEEGYRQAQNDYQEAQKMTSGRKYQALRRIVINGFTNLVATELGCSYGHAQKIIVDTIPENELASITAGYIDELDEILS